MQTTRPNVITTAGSKTCPTRRNDHLPNDGKWRSFPKVPNLLRYERTGIYFARIKVGGKTIRASLKTDVFTPTRKKPSTADARASADKSKSEARAHQQGAPRYTR